MGGIKDKVLAAQRSGIKKVLLPERNRKDLPDIPDQVRESLEIVFVDQMEDVLREALETTEGLPFSKGGGSFRTIPEA